jgi:hypothetical protein
MCFGVKHQHFVRQISFSWVERFIPKKVSMLSDGALIPIKHLQALLTFAHISSENDLSQENMSVGKLIVKKSLSSISCSINIVGYL